MNLFQWIVCPALAALCVWEIVRLVRPQASHRGALVRIAVWLLALVSVANPNLVQHVAQFAGIGRGADIVLYVTVFGFLLTTWWFYAENHRLRRDVTQLVRLYALDHAQRRDDMPRSGGPTPAGEGQKSRPSDE